MSDPLRAPRLAALALANAFAIIAACMGLNALINEHRDVDHIKKLAPSSTRVEVDVSDVHNTGIAATTGNILLGLLTFIFISISILPSTRALSIRTLKHQAAGLVVAVLLVIASMIPFTLYFATREAQVTAFIGTTQLPAAMVKAVQAQSGQESVYKKIWYLRLLAIFPWIAVFFGLIAIAALYLSAQRASPEAESTPSSPTETSEKGSTSHVEKTGDAAA